MIKFLLAAALLFGIDSAAQTKQLTGQVTDNASRPLPSASVFLSNTSYGTKTDDQGRFQISIPAGKYDLIISSIGYETYTQVIDADHLIELNIKLQPKAKELETVIIEPFVVDGWAKWGKFFIENFIGMSAGAASCTIKNYKAIRFRHSKSRNELTAIALEPLIIENKALGYRIEYQLEMFKYDFKNNYRSFIGYPFFQPLASGKGRERRWERQREDVYYGSMMHFMRSVYRNKIIEEGYEVRTMEHVPNLEKQRVKLAYSSNLNKVKRPDGTVNVTVIDADTAAYYDRILGQEDFKRVIGKNILPGDSIAYAMDSITAGLEFQNYLLIIYKKKQAPVEYIRLYPKSSTAMMSEIILINGKPIQIQSSGAYYEPLDLMSSGYWSWSEKIATMLPFDYKVP